MKKYIVTLTKSLGKISKVEVNSDSKKDIIDVLSIHFGNGIAELTESDIILKSDLPVVEQGFYYEFIDLSDKLLVL